MSINKAIIDQHFPAGNISLWYGQPTTTMSRDELVAFIGALHTQLRDSQEARKQLELAAVPRLGKRTKAG